MVGFLQTHLDSTSDTFSEKTAVFQVVLDDDVLGVGCAGEVGVDFLGVLLLVEILKFGLDVNLCLLVLVWACRAGKSGRTEGCDSG